MKKTRLFALTVAAATMFAAGAHAAPEGQKIDSGLGALPHYSKWLDKTGANPMGTRVAGESIDDGLGSLPHYSKWLDKSGRDPMGQERTLVGQLSR